MTQEVTHQQGVAEPAVTEADELENDEDVVEPLDVAASATASFPLGLRQRRRVSTSNNANNTSDRDVVLQQHEQEVGESMSDNELQQFSAVVDVMEDVHVLQNEMRHIFLPPGTQAAAIPNRRVVFSNNNDRAGANNRRNNNRAQHRHRNNLINNNTQHEVISMHWKLPGLYSLISTVLAAIAILTTSHHQQSQTTQQSNGLSGGFFWIPSSNPAPVAHSSSAVVVTPSQSAEKEVTSSDNNKKKKKDSLHGHPYENSLPFPPPPPPSSPSPPSPLEQQEHQQPDVVTNAWLLFEDAKWLLSALSPFEFIELARNYPFHSSGSVTSNKQSNKENYKWFASKPTEIPMEASSLTTSVSDFMDAVFSPAPPAVAEISREENKHDSNPFSFLFFWDKKDIHHKHEHQKSQRHLKQQEQHYNYSPASFVSWCWNHSIFNSSYIATMLDPSLLNPSETTFTDLVDKILTSTPRLLAIANLFLALTFLLHQAVAEWFLTTPTTGSADNSNNNINRRRQPQQQQPFGEPDWRTGSNIYHSSSTGPSGRERLGGFLVFKLLLISAVVSPDTLDLLILLSWYTLLSFLRSLVALCAQSTARTTASFNSGGTTAISMANVNNNNNNNNILINRSTNEQSSLNGQHTQPQVVPQPHVGVLQLLLTVLLWDFMAVAVCVGLFHGAGIGMVLLLTSDCAVLAFDIGCHILQHWLAVLESQQINAIHALEDEQFQHIQQQQNQPQQQLEQVNQSATAIPEAEINHRERGLMRDEDEGYAEYLDLSEIDTGGDGDYMNNSNDVIRQIDRQMEALEQQHVRRTSVLESAIFTLQICTQFLTILHFCHIWWLHGFQLSLIDGVLALQLHSAMSSASQKIAERRNMHRMDAAMNSQFENASVMDLQKATAAGDVCCICLGTMSWQPENTSFKNIRTASPSASTFASARSLSLSALAGGNRSAKRLSSCTSCSHVKKLACGHLYHTSCLREVVERARSMEAARCPLCRAPAVGGAVGDPHFRSQQTSMNHNNNANGVQGDQTRATFGTTANAANNINNDDDGNGNVAVGELQQDALFRFSTEGLFPPWLPLPAFSFEVVRRLPPQQQPAVRAPQMTQQPVADDAVGGDRNMINSNAGTDDMLNNGRVAGVRQRQQEPEERMDGRDSLFRRLMVALGFAVPTLTPEEERVALEQLTDMFPQYDRSDLLRCLRQRGSPQAVVEMILLGIFPGIPRGGGGGLQVTRENNDRNTADNNSNILVNG